MRLEDGNFYIRRDGAVVGPVNRISDLVWPFWIPSDSFRTYRADGLHELTGWQKSSFDLVATANDKPQVVKQ